ncbi:MAG: WxcM-like domain-containing protein [Nitrospinales bacterium]
MKDIEVKNLEKKTDARGWLIEVLRGERLGPNKSFGQIFVAVAPPGKVRGNHYHHRKIEWFCVLSGTGLLLLKDLETGEEKEITMGENEPKTVKITPGVIHAIKNVGTHDMALLVYVDEQFDPADPDTIYEKILD